MPSDRLQRSRRLAAIRDILAAQPVGSQAELAHRLRERGYGVTQSSVSRDLRSLPVGKVGGAWRLTGEDGRPEVDARLGEALRGTVVRIAGAGPNLLVVHTAAGTASWVGLLLDTAGLPEVVGTVAGDDTLFVAVSGRRERVRLERRLRAVRGPGGGGDG